MNNQIYYITPQDISNPNILYNFIYPNKELNYYCSDNFSPSFYIQLAYCGFISVCEKVESKYILLPEMQFEYAVLDFDNLHISKKIKKLLKSDSKYTFRVTEDFEDVLENIIEYHEEPWLEGRYKEMLLSMKNYFHPSINFKLLAIELIDNETKQIVAGEIGYRIGTTYTSLSGFRNKNKKFNNYGKLQMTLLAKYLKQNSFAFWNMGHPYMDYKTKLGAVVMDRLEFLKIWSEHRDN